MARRYEYLFALDGLAGLSHRHIWTGDGDLMLLGELWTPTNIVESVSIAGGAFASAESRVTVVLFAVTDSLRTEFMEDHGSVRVLLRQVTSVNDGVTWTLVPRAFSGRVSEAVLVGDRYRIDLVDKYGDPVRPAPRYWSDADQQRRAPGDRGLRYMALIASGVTVIWP